MTVSSLVRQASAIVETPVFSTTTGEAGKFEFPALTAGDYLLKAELPGFVSYRKAWLTVKPSQASRENVVLSVGTITQKVEVTVPGRPRPPAPAGTPQRIRVGGNVVAANLISQVRPIYPQSARDAGIEGTVHLQGIIGADGSLLMLRVVGRNDADLASAALESVRQWRYRPTLLNNEPVEVLTDIEVEFKLSY